jgi:hypothetical protein
MDQGFISQCRRADVRDIVCIEESVDASLNPDFIGGLLMDVAPIGSIGDGSIAFQSVDLRQNIVLFRWEGFHL